MELGDLGPDPIAAFRRWHAEAGDDAVALATASPDGVPAVRMLLLKGVDERGFVFHTSYLSPKAADLDANPRAALCFHWPPRQVRVEGDVERLRPADSDAYWATRPRESRISALASTQSAPVADRAAMVADADEVAASHEGADVPRPEWWGGYLLRPRWIELWSSGEHRLHDRFRYTRTDGGWEVQRLWP